MSDSGVSRMLLPVERVRMVHGQSLRRAGYRAPAGQRVADHVWLLGLMVIGQQNALGYAEAVAGSDRMRTDSNGLQ